MGTVAALCMLTSAGCGVGFAGDGPPQRARVTIVSESAAQVMVLTSIDFTVGSDGVIDTHGELGAPTALPFDRSYDLLNPPRLLVRVTPVDPAIATTVTLDVSFDGEHYATLSDNIGGSGGDAIEFLYRFRRPT